ncbi:MAG: major facilitator superfamily protein [Actinobacteria bacterium]|jgi:MFS family permease|nr:major facilitator superfamily protein [Actinomycetota bacterium]
MKLFEAGSLWSYKGYRFFWISTTIFVLGASAFPIALAVTVLDAGGTATSLGLILGARVLSGVLFAPFAGVWSDRLPRKQVMIVADLSRAGIVFAMVFVSAPQLPHFLLALAVFLMGVGDAFGAASAGAIMPSLLPDEKLPAGNVARGIVVKSASIIGPGIGGVSVFLIGGRLTFLITAIAFAVGTIFLAKIKEDMNTDRKPQEPFMVEMREGLRTVIEIPWIGAMIAMASFQLMVVLAAEVVLLPVITRREFGTNTAFALSAAAFSIGGIISAIACVKLKIKHQGQFSVLVWMLLIIAPLSLAFPISQTFVVVAYLLAGFSVGPWEAFWASAIQREVPRELQGRVFSLDHMGSVGLMPIGMALVGPAVNLFGEKELLIGASIFHVVVGFLVLTVPGVKDMKMPEKQG